MVRENWSQPIKSVLRTTLGMRGSVLLGYFKMIRKTCLRIILIGKEAGVYPSLAWSDLWVHQLFIPVCLCYLKHALGQKDRSWELHTRHNLMVGMGQNYFLKTSGIGPTQTRWLLKSSQFNPCHGLPTWQDLELAKFQASKHTSEGSLD